MRLFNLAFFFLHTIKNKLAFNHASVFQYYTKDWAAEGEDAIIACDNILGVADGVGGYGEEINVSSGDFA